MRAELAEGVTLNVLPSQKFKTITIKIKFKALLDSRQITKRTLISYLLNTNSQHYPTQTDFRKALSELYGARLSTEVSKKGNFHIISLSMTIVNDKYLKAEGILEKAIEFLKNILFYPNVYHEAFHKETFEREVENLRDEYEAIYDDKEDYASIALNTLLFETEAQRIPSFGQIKDLDTITAENLYKTYREMISSNEIDIFILGDVEETTVKKAFEQFDFKDRMYVTQAAFYKHSEYNEVKEKTEEQELTQAKFNLGFSTDIFYHQPNYYAGQVFNGLYGGYPHSKLFVNVREKESLAYTISSGIDTFSGSMFIHAGIDQTQAKRVEQIILDELNAVRKGDFSEEALQQTKELLKNSLYQSEDNASSMIEKNYASKLVSEKQIEIEEWANEIEAVTRQDIIDVAERVQLRAKFLLVGKEG